MEMRPPGRIRSTLHSFDPRNEDVAAPTLTIVVDRRMHSFIPTDDADADESRRAQRQEHVAAIKRWTRDYLHLADDTPIAVTELACADPGCPLLETVIAVFEEGRARRWKFTRPHVAVTKLMVQQTLATPPS